MFNQAVRAFFMAAVCLGGCALDRFDPTPPVLPAAYQYGGAGTPGSELPLFAAFGSPQLDQMIAAASDSPGLTAAAARLEQADALARQAGGALLPEVTADLGATRFDGRAHGTSARETDWSAVLAASYELDFWGKNRAARAAAAATASAARADLDTVRITMTTEVAASYFKLQSLRERIALAQSNLLTATDLLEFIQARFAAGLLPPADLAAQRAAVANAELVIPSLQQQEVETLGSLAALLGRVPEGFAVSTQPLSSLVEPAIAPGLPAELLQRRPDLMTAEYNLRAAHADLAVARAALFPSLSLSASGGVANPAVQAAVITLAGTGLSLTAGADLVQSVFDNGRRRAVIRATAAREQELLAAYRGAIIAALVDVENALAALAHLEAQRRAEDEAVTESERAFESTRLRYREGSIDYVAVLATQQALYLARTQRVEYTQARLQALLGLNAALGGGWAPAAKISP